LTRRPVRVLCAALLLLAAAGCGTPAPSPDESAGTPTAESSAPAGPSPEPVTEIPAQPRLTAEGRTSQPPWSAPIDPAGRVAAAGLPMLGAEGQVEHIHAHLDVIVDGKPVEVPANLGIELVAQQISPLHTHDTSGIVHIESPVKVPFSLGQFMTEWDVALSESSLGGLKAIAGKQFRAYVDGKPVDGNPAAIIFEDHQQIALVYGTAPQHQNPPASYDWGPSGL
jgi:hypothetical protein